MEGTYSWADGSALTSYGAVLQTNPPWQNNQPSNSGVGQHCISLGSSGWNDVICNSQRKFVCQRTASS